MNESEDTPRFKLLNCKLCNQPFEKHKPVSGGLFKFESKWGSICIAAAFVDFHKERIENQ